MAFNTLKGHYEPQNREKYVGKYPITFRSSWERSICIFFDGHPDVVSWASEHLQIPYQHPIEKRFTVYIPDFIVTFRDKNNQLRCEMWEIKPLKEVPGMVTSNTRLSKMDRLRQIVNAAKWKAARSFCTKRGIYFRVVTENVIQKL